MSALALMLFLAQLGTHSIKNVAISAQKGCILRNLRNWEMVSLKCGRRNMHYA